MMLLDTSGLLCLHHRAEPLHKGAVKLFDAAEQKFVHSYVLAEFVALAAARGLPRQEVLGFVADIEDSFEVTVVYVDEALHRAALALLQRRLDKTWSLCDAVSFVLMERFGIAEALTTDHHFEQAGFGRLLVA
jgi:predicted nucleic acid-binding protein